MGRPAGSKNGQKKAAVKKAATEAESPSEETSELRASPAMDGANGPTPEEKRQYLERYRAHRRALASIMEDAADERGTGRSILKQFENQGGNPKMLKRMWELTDMTRPEAEAEVRNYLGYAAEVVGIRVSFDEAGQGILDDVVGESAPEAAAARAYDAGWNWAKNGGQVTENPHQPGSITHQDWHRGFSDRIWEQANGPSKETAETDSPASADAA